MSPIIFSQESIFHLHRLSRVVQGLTGKRFKLEDDEQRSELIRYCDITENPTIHQQFQAFLSTIDPETFAKMPYHSLIRFSTKHPLYEKNPKKSGSE
jgi:hypothetical protein